MLVNKAWYKEGRRRLYRDKDDIMEWLRLKRINKLDGFIRYLNLDRLDEYIRIYKNLIKIREDLNIKYNKAQIAFNEAQDKLPDTYFEYGDEEYDEHRKLEVKSRLSDHPDKDNYDFDAFLLMHPDYVVTPDNNDELNGK